MLPDEALAFKAWVSAQESQCTYRCVVLPDIIIAAFAMTTMAVSMHLQVRGAP